MPRTVPRRIRLVNVLTTIAQEDLPKDPGILRTAARHNGVNVGVYATVERPGRVRRGDEITLQPS